MPQMAPMGWVSLYMLFLTVFLFFNIINYFIIFYYPNMKISFKKKISLNWKW